MNGRYVQSGYIVIAASRGGAGSRRAVCLRARCGLDVVAAAGGAAVAGASRSALDLAQGAHRHIMLIPSLSEHYYALFNSTLFTVMARPYSFSIEHEFF